MTSPGDNQGLAADKSSTCTGRFAPSPSGPLHFGSLVSALASFLDIRSKGGLWLLRIDDLDTPRTKADSEAAILTTLAAHELHWDAPLSRQSEHIEHYHDALHNLADQHLLFFCNCSRQSLRQQKKYPGNCRHHLCRPKDLKAHLGSSRSPGNERSHAIRLRVPEGTHAPTDELQSPDAVTATAAEGDYIVFRRDSLVSYQLAVVVDDALTGVNRVVRGADLLPTTARQNQLHRLLGSTPPAWLHLPVLLNERSMKLSKQARSQPVDDSKPSTNLDIALQLLGQNPPTDAATMPTPTLIKWAIDHWDSQKLPAEETFSTFFGW